jgi:hypothetical protein
VPLNLSLKATAFEIINDLRERVHKQCGQVVSCTDITAIAARDFVFLVNASPPPTLFFTFGVKFVKRTVVIRRERVNIVLLLLRTIFFSYFVNFIKAAVSNMSNVISLLIIFIVLSQT